MRSAKKNLRIVCLIIGVLIVIGVFFASGEVQETFAESPSFQTTPLPIISVPMSNEDCLECHNLPNMYTTLPSGETLNLSVDASLYRNSAHGRQGYACVQCHTDITGFPHPELDAQDRRDVTLYMTKSCEGCHREEYELYMQGDHAQLLEEGDKDAAVCTDCHGFHDLEKFEGLRTDIAQACRKCHAEIYDEYKRSIHGEALVREYNLDVPTCVDCHRNHANMGPDQPGFHLFSPQICARCHANETLMNRYDINTDVFETYVADFHGTTIVIFEKIAPDQETNKAVCVDCHGVHSILPPEDVSSTVYKQNLLDTCRRCHQEATLNFPDAWLSHYRPDPEHNTIVYLVDLFYQFFIPGTLGLMAVFVVTDFWRRRIRPSIPDEIPDEADTIPEEEGENTE